MRDPKPLAALAALIALAGATALPGCGDDEAATGTLTLELGDAPYPYEAIASAEVTVVGADAHLPGGFVDLGVDTMRLDLLQLRNGVTQSLAEAELPTGSINEIRLRVEDPLVTLVGGEEFALQVPSGSSSGLKIFPDPDIEVAADETTRVYLDFDVSESFKPIPASATTPEEITSFQFTPTLRVANLGETGAVAGTVFDGMGTPDEADDAPLPGATVTAELMGDVKASTVTEPDGTYRLLGLDPGTYDVRAAALGYDEEIGPAGVAAGTDTEDVNRILNAVP